MDRERLIKDAVFVAGSPRSGTTFMARALNTHPQLVTAIDDHVYECWALYYYPARTGLAHSLGRKELNGDQVKKILQNHLFRKDVLIGAAPSDKTRGLSRTQNHTRNDDSGTIQDEKLERYNLPLHHFPTGGRLCLKSPELSFVLPQLANLLPESSFILAYRPIIEIAESMFRKGNIKKKSPRFHKRWEKERDLQGRLIPPPSIPPDWYDYWQEASGFQHCLLNAAGYQKAIAESIGQLGEERYLLYNHALLRREPGKVFDKLARFLDIDSQGFAPAQAQVNSAEPDLTPDIFEQYQRTAKDLYWDQWLDTLESTVSK